jgi:hypothetical protein
MRRGCPFTLPPAGRLALRLLVEVFQNARALFWQQCGLFSDRLAPGRGFLFRSPHQRAKARSKDCACAGIFVNADTAVLWFHDFCHDGKP